MAKNPHHLIQKWGIIHVTTRFSVIWFSYHVPVSGINISAKKKRQRESSKGTSSQPSHLITSYAECIGKIVDEQYIANFTL